MELSFFFFFFPFPIVCVRTHLLYTFYGYTTHSLYVSLYFCLYSFSGRQFSKDFVYMIINMENDFYFSFLSFSVISDPLSVSQVYICTVYIVAQAKRKRKENSIHNNVERQHFKEQVYNNKFDCARDALHIFKMFFNQQFFSKYFGKINNKLQNSFYATAILKLNSLCFFLFYIHNLRFLELINFYPIYIYMQAFFIGLYFFFFFLRVDH